MNEERDNSDDEPTIAEIIEDEKRDHFEVLWGSDINATISQAIQRALSVDNAITFNFNGISITVCGGSEDKLIYREWHRALCGYTDIKEVGPFPAEDLTQEEIESDAKIKAQHDKEEEERSAKADEATKAKRDAVALKLKHSPGISLKDEAGWNKSVEVNKDDPYSAAVMEYADLWARLMQREMASGKALVDIADTTSHEADISGITGFMYGCAVSILSVCWEHGEALRLWHNKDTQIGTEGDAANESGGVLNPALLNIGE